jgi:alpha-tubulin suppressor-like RCC1 family protein
MADADVPEVARANVTAIAAGWGFSLALRADGQVVAWIDPAYLTSLADCNLTTPPVDVTESSVRAVQLAAGMMHAVALLSDGRVVSWGCRNGRQEPFLQLPARATAVAAG